MARLMLSAGMLTDFASAMIVRRRGFMSGSPPPLRAATVSSLMMRVKILPRFASAAPFLCLMVCHLEWPDMQKTPGKSEENDVKCYHNRLSAPGFRLPGFCLTTPGSPPGLDAISRVSDDTEFAEAGSREPEAALSFPAMMTQTSERRSHG